MQLLHSLRLAALAAVALLAASITARAADPLLSVVPRDTEVVIGINVGQILDSDFFQRIQKVRPRILAQLSQQSTRFGIDIQKDVENIYLFGRIGQREMGGMILTGKINQEKLLATLRMNGDYKKTQVGDMPIHEWFDRASGAQKYATFMPDGPVIFWNSKETMDASLEAIGNDTKSFLSLTEAKQLPATRNSDAAWVVLSNRLNRIPIPPQYQLVSLTAIFTLGPKDLNLRLLLLPGTDEAKDQWVTMGRQMLLAMQFQEENEMAQEIGYRTDIKANEGGRTIDLRSKINLDVIMDTISMAIQNFR